MRTGESPCFISYKRLGSFAKLATSSCEKISVLRHGLADARNDLVGEVTPGEGQTGLSRHCACSTLGGRGHKEARVKIRQRVWCSLVVLLLLWSGLSRAQQPKPGGTLRIALPGDPAFYDAHQGPAMGAQAFWTSNNIYNSLLATTPPPELKIVPDLAKSWEVLDEGRTYVFHLHEGVKFHDGTDFNAQAAKWNIDRILDPEVKSWIRPYYEDVEQVEAVDTYTLRIRLKEPSGALPIALGGYYQGILMASPKAFETYGKDWLYHPVGTGPFTFKEWIPGKHVLLEKNPNYFKPGLPYLDRLEYRIMKDPLTASTALRAGEIDFLSRVPMQQVPILEKSQGIHVITGLEMAPTLGFLNMRVKPFDDVRARRAVGGYGLDRAEIARVAFQGRAKPLVSVLAPGVQDASTSTKGIPTARMRPSDC